MTITKQETKDFLLYLALGAIIVLSINTYLITERQTRILNNQDRGLTTLDNNEDILKDIKNIIENISAEKGQHLTIN